MQTIFAKLLYEMEKGLDTVLATIIRESGSAPRGAGAQMLVDGQGPQAGTIGGGNVENLSILHAKELLARRSGDIPVSCANVDKARELLGWEARRDVEDMCRDSWNWQRNNPLGYEK